ncbi:MAG: phosphoribosylglycinamide formyltransferase [Tannerella sp.]|jgi:phosphoribosylglycinamide formyltransferase-1|nr:phosphoribosylglycinamide formyltransferase [Tannerella sp.]
MKIIAVLASGSGTNAENIAKYFENNSEIRVGLIISNRLKAGVHARALSLGVPSFTFSNEEFRDGSKILAKLSEYNVDFIVLAGFMSLLPPVIINEYKDRIVNIHPALLPKYGGKGMFGRHVHEAVVASGEKETGITVHFVNERYDEGEIIFRSVMPVCPSDTVEDVERKVHALEYAHYPAVIENIVKNL